MSLLINSNTNVSSQYKNRLVVAFYVFIEVSLNHDEENESVIHFTRHPSQIRIIFIHRFIQPFRKELYNCV